MFHYWTVHVLIKSWYKWPTCTLRNPITELNITFTLIIETLTDVVVHLTQPIAESLVQDVKLTLPHKIAKRKLATGTSVFQYINLKQSKLTRCYTYLEFTLSSLFFFFFFYNLLLILCICFTIWEWQMMQGRVRTNPEKVLTLNRSTVLTSVFTDLFSPPAAGS